MRRRNPGNTGHRGYKMRTITSFTPGVANLPILHAQLDCGHNNVWPIYVPRNETVEQAKARDLPDYTEKYVGTRARCERCTRETESSARDEGRTTA